MRNLFDLENVYHDIFAKSANSLTHIYSQDINLDDQKIILDHFQAEKLALLTQEHGDQVHYVDQNYTEVSGDAMVTDQPSVLLGIKTADCVCAFLASCDQRVIGAAHLGWRGARSNLLGNTLKLMRQFSDDKIVAFISPCIRKQSYQVDQSFYDDFVCIKPYAAKFFEVKDDKIYFDLPGFVKYELNMFSIYDIRDDEIDTYTSTEYFSFRFAQHQGVEEKRRNLSCIVLK